MTSSRLRSPQAGAETNQIHRHCVVDWTTNARVLLISPRRRHRSIQHRPRAPLRAGRARQHLHAYWREPDLIAGAALRRPRWRRRRAVRRGQGRDDLADPEHRRERRPRRTGVPSTAARTTCSTTRCPSSASRSRSSRTPTTWSRGRPPSSRTRAPCSPRPSRTRHNQVSTSRVSQASRTTTVCR